MRAVISAEFKEVRKSNRNELHKPRRLRCRRGNDWPSTASECCVVGSNAGTKRTQREGEPCD